MPAIGNITIDDATPASAIVFKPRKADPEKSIWVKNGYNASNTFSAADTILSVGVSPASAKRPTTRVKTELSFPNPSYAVTDTTEMSTARFYTTVIVPDDFSEADRQDFEAFCENFIADAVFTSAVVDSEGSY